MVSFVWHIICFFFCPPLVSVFPFSEVLWVCSVWRKTFARKCFSIFHLWLAKFFRKYSLGKQVPNGENDFTS
uniref:Putative ovule protein n=1 Tax=Solanum chacoense TaxID=4108 RepID=A0A0V0GYP4_SOLCH